MGSAPPFGGFFSQNQGKDHLGSTSPITTGLFGRKINEQIVNNEDKKK